MAAIHLSHSIGGDIFLGFISAVAFATILAVVSGLTLAGASAIGRDFFVYVVKKGRRRKKELIVSKLSSVIIGLLAISLGIFFEKQNVAFMVGLAFAVARKHKFSCFIINYNLEKSYNKWSILWRNDWFNNNCHFSCTRSNNLG